MKNFFWGAALLFLLLNGCGNDMKDQPRFKPLQKTTFFEDGRSSRPLVEGTVPRGYLREDDLLYRGKIRGQVADEFPFEISEAMLRRGQERFNIYCALCHGQTGYGRGIVVERGFPQAASFHSEKLKNAPVGHFFDVMSHGFGSMPAYDEQLSIQDRWAIAGYIRALQYSQSRDLSQIPPKEQAKLLRQS